MAKDEFKDEDGPKDGDAENTTAEFLEVRDEGGFKVGHAKLMDPDAENEDEREQPIEFALIEVDGQWYVSFKQLFELRMHQGMQGMNGDE